MLIYGSANYYIYTRAMQAIPAESTLRSWFPWLFLFLVASYVVGRFTERVWLSPVSNVLTWVGSFWLALMVYFLLAVILIDIVRLLMLIFPNPGFLVYHAAEFKKYLFITVSVGASVLVSAGYWNATHPKITRLDLHINKTAGELKTLHIAAASDIHMGTMVGPRRTGKLVELLNGLKPDLILLAGDIVDEDLAPVISQDLGRALLKLKAPLGVYAITGNHEYIGGAEAAVNYLEQHGIRMLRDTVIKIQESFYLAGRNDRDSRRFKGVTRKTIPEILGNFNASLPVIMMDHQPFDLQKAVDAGVDFQLSGHTHHGQLWPFNYITNSIYEISKGYKQKGSSHFFVSSGYGTWGPPVRLGSSAEILDIHISFN